MKRKTISKGKRFDIFRRDGFTCQYCGEQPPNVVLHVDHIRPVSKGGTNNTMNLVTSCADCNLGKAAKLLDSPQKPDADMSWLEAQQEIAELKRYQDTLALKRIETNEVVNALQELWADYAELDWAPETNILRRAIAQYGPDLVEAAIVTVASKVAGGYLSKNGSGWLKYLYGTLSTMNRERD